MRNITAFIMPDKDSFVCNGAACSGEVVLGYPFIRYAGLDVKDFVLSHIYKLFFIDYERLNIKPPGTRMVTLGINLLTKETGGISDQVLKQVISRLRNMVSNGDIVIQAGDSNDYKYVSVGLTDESNLEMAVEDMLHWAESSLPENYHTTLSDIVERARDIFFIRHCDDLPVNVALILSACEGPEHSMNVKQRTYFPEQ